MINDEERHIVCPICQWDYVHIEKVEVNRMGKITVVAGHAPVDFVKEDVHERGSSVTTYFFCEGGHRWKEVRQFHKGNVFEEIVRLPGLKSETFESSDGLKSETFEWPHELPRD